MTADRVREAFAILRTPPLQTVSSPGRTPLAFHLALAHGLSVYDGTYAALAVMLGRPLVIADGKVARKLAEAGRKTILSKE